MKKILILLLTLLIISGCDAKKAIQPSFDNVTDSSSQSQVYDYLNQSLDSFIFSNTELPKFNNQVIDWNVVSGDAIIENNIISKTNNADEYEMIVLEATVNDESYLFDNLELMDSRAAYVMSYFGGDDEDNYQNAKLAYTYNGLLWYLVNNDEPIVRAELGSKQIRDPYIVRKKNGTFSMIATQGWNNSSIYVWDSDDLCTYNNERLLQVNKSSSDQKMSEKQAWAPEAFYDRIIDKYVIYWSSPEDGGMYYNLTSDFNDISYPKQLLDTGFTVIDGTIVKIGYDYTIILKDEREPMEEYSSLFVGTSSTNYLGFDTFSENRITGHQSEGPFVMKGDVDYIVFYDDYTRKQFQAMTTKDIRSEEFEELNMLTDVVAPMISPRHASVIPVTWNELVKIIKEYKTEDIE